jgi:ParB-like chromosome segregation protein Spo0J
MVRLKIVDILATSPVDPEGHLDPERVERYRHSIDQLAPVVVFETEDGLLLADGYHRIVAALREGHEAIEADVRKGSRKDALEYAAAAGARQRGLSPEEVRDHIVERYGPDSTDRQP